MSERQPHQKAVDVATQVSSVRQVLLQASKENEHKRLLNVIVPVNRRRKGLAHKVEEVLHHQSSMHEAVSACPLI